MSFELSANFISKANELFAEMELDTVDIPCPYDTPRAFYELWVAVKSRKDVILNWENDNSSPKLADVWPKEV